MPKLVAWRLGHGEVLIRIIGRSYSHIYSATLRASYANSAAQHGRQHDSDISTRRLGRVSIDPKAFAHADL